MRTFDKINRHGERFLPSHFNSGKIAAVAITRRPAKVAAFQSRRFTYRFERGKLRSFISSLSAHVTFFSDAIAKARYSPEGLVGITICEFAQDNGKIESGALCGDREGWLIESSKNGDENAYRKLIETYQDHVGQIMWRFCRDRQVHEELVHETFVEAYFSLGTYKHKAPFSHWLARIATHTGHHYWKKQAADAKSLALSDEQWAMLAQIDNSDPGAGEAAELLFKLLSNLGSRDRLVLTLRYMEGCDVNETAMRTGWSPTMVKVQTMRARAKLKKLFMQKHPEMKSWQ